MRSWGKLLCMLIMVAASSARAQELPGWLKVRASYLASEQASEPVEPSPRRGPAFLAAAGVGVVLGAVVYTSFFARKGAWCSESDQRVKASLPLGISLAAVGATMVTVGAIRVARAARLPAMRPSVQPQFAFTALGTGLGTFALATFANYGNLGCISS
jgi:hypothetical protein